MYWKDKLKNTVDLYSSDLGFETGENNDFLHFPKSSSA